MTDLSLEIYYCIGCCTGLLLDYPNTVPTDATEEELAERVFLLQDLIGDMAKYAYQLSDNKANPRLYSYFETLSRQVTYLNKAMENASPDVEVALIAFAHFSRAHFKNFCQKKLGMRNYDGVELEPFLETITNVTDGGIQGCALALSHLSTQSFVFWEESGERFNFRKVKQEWEERIRFLKLQTKELFLEESINA